MEPWLAACRFAHFLALMAGFGAALYVEAFAPHELRAGLAAIGPTKPVGREVSPARMAPTGIGASWQSVQVVGSPMAAIEAWKTPGK